MVCAQNPGLARANLGAPIGYRRAAAAHVFDQAAHIVLGEHLPPMGLESFDGDDKFQGLVEGDVVQILEGGIFRNFFCALQPIGDFLCTAGQGFAVDAALWREARGLKPVADAIEQLFAFGLVLFFNTFANGLFPGLTTDTGCVGDSAGQPLASPAGNRAHRV